MVAAGGSEGVKAIQRGYPVYRPDATRQPGNRSHSCQKTLQPSKRRGSVRFLKNGQERRTCTGGGGTIDVRHSRCPVCGKEPV
jgi:hypothetical protein